QALDQSEVVLLRREAALAAEPAAEQRVGRAVRSGELTVAEPRVAELHRSAAEAADRFGALRHGPSDPAEQAGAGVPRGLSGALASLPDRPEGLQSAHIGIGRERPQ